MPRAAALGATFQETAVASLYSGGHVMLWTSDDTDAQGQRVGGEFLVNTATAGDQNVPDVVGDNLGGSIAIWDSAEPGRPGIYTKRVVAP